MADYRTKIGNWASVDPRRVWNRTDFAYLGTIRRLDGSSYGWAWHADGKSIDIEDDGFDLVGFNLASSTPYFWLGAEAEAA